VSHLPVRFGTFYTYLRNKRQVFLSLYAEHHKQVLALDLSSLDFTTAPRQAIRMFLQQALRYRGLAGLPRHRDRAELLQQP
jgi:AcrR family transcriptional regulator